MNQPEIFTTKFSIGNDCDEVRVSYRVAALHKLILLGLPIMVSDPVKKVKNKDVLELFRRDLSKIVVCWNVPEGEDSTKMLDINKASNELSDDFLYLLYREMMDNSGREYSRSRSQQ